MSLHATHYTPNQETANWFITHEQLKQVYTNLLVEIQEVDQDNRMCKVQVKMDRLTSFNSDGKQAPFPFSELTLRYVCLSKLHYNPEPKSLALAFVPYSSISSVITKTSTTPPYQFPILDALLLAVDLKSDLMEDTISIGKTAHLELKTDTLKTIGKNGDYFTAIYNLLKSALNTKIIPNQSLLTSNPSLASSLELLEKFND